MRLGADPTDLERLARIHRLLAERLRRIARVSLHDVGWTGRDADLLRRTHRDGVVGPAVRAALEADRRAEALVGHARAQRAASLGEPGAVTVRRDASRGGRFVHRVGDEQAATVVVLVPGVGTDLQDTPSLEESARTVHEALAPSVDSLAVVAWLGYDPPDTVPGALDLRPADEGAGLLVAEVARLRRGDRPGGPAEVVLVGHSYGAVVVARAVALGAGARTAVLLGAPGIGVGDPERVTGRPGVRVLAATATDDPIAVVPAVTGGRYGADPRGLVEQLPTTLPGHGDYLRDPAVLAGLADAVGEPVRSTRRRP